jgi:hypothetical protein
MTNPSNDRAADALLIARLAALTPTEYDRVRKTEAEAVGIRLATLDELVREARRAASGPSPTAAGAPPHPGAAGTPDPVTALIAELNAQYMVVNEAGKGLVYASAEDPILHRKYFERMGVSDLRTLYMNRRVTVGRDGNGNPIMRPVADVWLNHADRRQFVGGIIFDPSGLPTPAGKLNLWQGFGVEPRPGSWTLMQAHIRDVICSSAADQYDYLIRWIARMLQHPAEQGEVAVILKGQEGVGKGTLAKPLMRIFGQHGLSIFQAVHLVGNFNAHLRDCVFLFADEAFYAGDRQHLGVLKSIITEPLLTIEAKYQNAVQTPNYLHLMMASNEEWVVPASLESRRFFIPTVSSARKGDHAYFAAVLKELDAGGYAAMLHDLLRLNLTGFEVRNVPTTEGLQAQKKLSLGTSEAWWFDVLHRGYAYRSKHGLADFFTLALFDPNDHPGAVDVGDLERNDLRGAQSRSVGHAQCRLVFEARRRIQQTRHLLRAQHDRQLPRLPDKGQLAHHVGPA